jgi:hypothetical protein
VPNRSETGGLKAYSSTACQPERMTGLLLRSRTGRFRVFFPRFCAAICEVLAGASPNHTTMRCEEAPFAADPNERSTKRQKRRRFGGITFLPHGSPRSHALMLITPREKEEKRTRNSALDARCKRRQKLAVARARRRPRIVPREHNTCLLKWRFLILRGAKARLRTARRCMTQNLSRRCLL